MTDLTQSLAPVGSAWRTLVRRLARAFVRANARSARAAQMRRLLDLDDYLLRDIGLSPETMRVLRRQGR